MCEGAINSIFANEKKTGLACFQELSKGTQGNPGEFIHNLLLIFWWANSPMHAGPEIRHFYPTDCELMFSSFFI